MATAALRGIQAFGLKTATFLQSLFLFPFNAIMQAVGLLPGFRQTNQPTLSCSPFGSVSSSSSSRESSNSDVGDGDRHYANDMMTASSSATASAPQEHKAPVSQIKPALPRIAHGKKENRVSDIASATKASAQLTDKFSCLELDETANPKALSPRILQDAVNGAGSVREDGTCKQCVQSGTNDIGAGGTQEVTRAPAVPLTHLVSQTSKPKEIAVRTIQLDGVTVQIRDKVETPEQAAERTMHSRFMREALDMARLALRTNETPVGCVFVYKGRVIAKGMNATNVTRNGTRHAELMAISALLSYSPNSDLEPSRNASLGKGATTRLPLGDKTNEAQATEETSSWGDVDPKDGHLYPYGQKLHPSPRVDPSVIHESTLYVTVEPCVMCASLLRQLRVKKVYFGAVNDKFGGTGGVFRIHKNSPFSMVSAPPSPAPQGSNGIVRPVLERRPASTDVVSEEHNPVEEANNGNSLVVSPIETSGLPGDGGNIERGYEAEGGWGRDEAVTLLRQFYVQENNRAPVPRKKEGRAARLAALMERDGQAVTPVDESTAVLKSQDDSGIKTPATRESTVEDATEATVAVAATEAIMDTATPEAIAA